MNYKESLEYLDSLSFTGIKLGLENISKILAAFENPHLKIPCIHVAGTNGKGSISVFLESILRSSGNRVGLFTSPHFLDFRERIQIDREYIPRDHFIALSLKLKTTIKSLDILPTYFEFSTALAFLFFLDQKVDWIILEVGLGGRLDSTNVCEPEVSIISSISMDHQAYLGNTLESIAFEKASIIKKAGIVIADKQKRNVEKVILDIAKKQGAEVKFREKDFFATRKSFNWKDQTFDFDSPYGKLEGLKTNLIGTHQVFNASLAIESVMNLKERGFLVPKEAIREGVLNCQWEGRLEVTQENPFIVLDSAHNVDSVKFLTKAIREHFKYNKCIVVLGLMKDKDIEKMGLILLEIADQMILTKPNLERSFDPVVLKKVLSNIEKPIDIIEEIQYSIHTAKKLANPGDLICITGSLFTIAEAKHFLKNEENS